MAKKLKLGVTERGFAFAQFVDLYGSTCSIQESSLAEQDAIWLGVEKDWNAKECVRMHLSREQAESLLPLIERFVKTGRLRTKARHGKICGSSA